MTKRETERLVLGLRSAGWNDEKINDFMLYMRLGEEKYKPKPDQPKEKTEE